MQPCGLGNQIAQGMQSVHLECKEPHSSEARLQYVLAFVLFETNICISKLLLLMFD